MPTLHATPYDITYAGFYFETAEEFTERMKKAPFEEVEIQFIDGTDEDCLLFKLCKPHQGNVAGYFEALDTGYEGHRLAALSYLMEYQGTTWEDATASGALDDVDVYEMTTKELAEQFAEEGIYPAGVNEQVLPYLDYDLLARDLSMDYTEIECLGNTYCVRAS
ncbi:antirestriction protein ArdA [Paludibaculum fermentans]|uniref:antirestriction protein ArdA n=1 Tax=Paludibaculum fermentans TaxID=1473598 RepID=UPI003EBB809E